MRLRPFPLLAEGIPVRYFSLFCFKLYFQDYKPDEVNLNADKEDRDFWLTIMKKSTKSVIAKAIESQCADNTAEARGAAFEKDYHKQIEIIREKSL